MEVVSTVEATVALLSNEINDLRFRVCRQESVVNLMFVSCHQLLSDIWEQQLSDGFGT